MTEINHISPRKPQAQRQDWIDCLRGVAMLLVVLLHCENHLFGLGVGKVSLFSSICGSFRQPLFMFISGYFACSAYIMLNAHDLSYSIRRRMTMVLTPTAIFMVLFFFIYRLPIGVTFYGLLCDPYKGLGWYPIVAFECFAIAAPLIGMLNSRILPRRAALTLILLAGMASLCIHHLFLVNPPEFGDWYHIITHPRIFELFFYFCIGCIVRELLRSKQPPYVSSWTLAGFLLIPFAMLYWVAPMLKFVYFDWRIMPFTAAFCLGLFFLFARMHGVMNNQNVIGRSLSIIGRNTLQIYLMHLMIVNAFDFAAIQSLCEWGTLDPNVMLPFNILLTLAITAVCLYADILFARTGVYRYVYPKLPARRPATAVAASL